MANPVFQIEHAWARLMNALGGTRGATHVTRIRQGQLTVRALVNLRTGR